MSTPTVRSTTRSWRSPLTGLVCAVVAVLATSCTPSNAEPTPTPSLPPPVSTTPGPDIDLEAEEKAALAAWETGVAETYRIIGEEDYDNAPERLTPYFDGEELADTLDLLQAFQQQGARSTGAPRQVAVADSAVSVGEDRITMSGFMCHDLTKVQTTIDGKPLEFPPYQVDNATLARSLDGTWKVIESESTQLDDLSSSRCEEVLA